MTSGRVAGAGRLGKSERRADNRGYKAVRGVGGFKILDLVQNAALKKARTENFITRFARVYTPVVVFLALSLAVIPPLVSSGADLFKWINRALVFLVVSCPCALVVSVPLSYFGGIGGASRRGILVKVSSFLDALTQVDTVVFDKTGTLTKGAFKVGEIRPAGLY